MYAMARPTPSRDGLVHRRRSLLGSAAIATKEAQLRAQLYVSNPSARWSGERGVRRADGILRTFCR